MQQLSDYLTVWQKENLRLKDQINEMELFLNDYGMIWVGNDK